MGRPMNAARRAAIDARQRRYQGEPCKAGHDGTRYTSTGACCDCQAGLTRIWRQAVRGADDFDCL